MRVYFMKLTARFPGLLSNPRSLFSLKHQEYND